MQNVGAGWLGGIALAARLRSGRRRRSARARESSQ
jgi:hypothetical protein